MHTIRKLTAAAVLTACAITGATQVGSHDSDHQNSSSHVSSTTQSARTRLSTNATAMPAARMRSMGAGDGHLDARTTLGNTKVDETVHSAGALTDPHVVTPKVGATTPVGIPASVDLRAWKMPVIHQGNVSSCVAWTIDYEMMGWYAKRQGLNVDAFAPMYTYSQINGGVDHGSYASQALNVAMTKGSDVQSDYWQGNFDWKTQPTAAEHANAAHYKITGYEPLFNQYSGIGSNGSVLIQNALAAGKPVAISLPIRYGFDHISATVPDQDTTTASRGGHEILALGYDQSGLLVQNSWGETWGDHGFGRLAWNVVAADVNSAYTIDGIAVTASDNTNTTNTNTTNTNTTNTTNTTSAATMGTVDVAVASTYQLNGTVVPVRVKWSASGSVARYVVWTSTNGGTWVDTTSRLSAQTDASVVLNLQQGTSYRFAVAAFDTSGNRSDYAYSAVFSPKVYDDSIVAASAGWTRYSWDEAVSGTGITSSTADATVQFNFTGRGVALVAPKFSTGGQANMYVDGNFVQTIDLYSATRTARVVVFSRYWGSAGTHTVTLKIVGTAGRPRVDVDAIAVVG
jgi:C1A family cysteine protease